MQNTMIASILFFIFFTKPLNCWQQSNSLKNSVYLPGSDQVHKLTDFFLKKIKLMKQYMLTLVCKELS